MESPSLTCQEAIALELTASSIFHMAAWLDLWSTAVAKIASSDSVRSSVDETAFIRLLQSSSKATSYLTNLSANVRANIILMRRDAALAKISHSEDVDFLLSLQNGDIFVSQLLLPKKLETAINRRRTDTNDRLVQQAVSKSNVSRSNTARKTQQALAPKPTQHAPPMKKPSQHFTSFK